MSDGGFAVSNGAHKIRVGDLVPVVNDGILDRILAGAGNIREAQALGSGGCLGPLNLFGLEA